MSVRSGSRSMNLPFAPLACTWVRAGACSMLFVALLAGGVRASELVESIRRVRPSIIAVGTLASTPQARVYLSRDRFHAVGDGSMVVTTRMCCPNPWDLDAYESIAIAIPGDDGPGASGRKAELLA